MRSTHRDLKCYLPVQLKFAYVRPASLSTSAVSRPRLSTDVASKRRAQAISQQAVPQLSLILPAKSQARNPLLERLPSYVDMYAPLPSSPVLMY